MQPAVFLDLEKTIIEDPLDLSATDSISLIKGAAPAIASLRGLGYRFVVVANHDGVARGQCSVADVQALHERVEQLLRASANGAQIDAFYDCPYHPRGVVKQFKKDHPNRKPKPGMLLQAAEEMSLDLSASWMIGDELADVQAGHAAGTRTILLRPDADRLQPVDPASIEGITAEEPDVQRPAGPDFFAVSLIDAARLIAQQPRIEPADAKQRTEQGKWDSAKIAKLQVPRPKSTPQPSAPPAPATSAKQGSPSQAQARSFRPWDAPVRDDEADKPIVSKPYRRRHEPADDAGRTAQTPRENVASSASPSSPEQPSGEVQIPGKPEIPSTIRDAIQKKKATREHPEDSEQHKLLRMMLQELRAQRGASQDFSFLTIVAVALQLVAVICLLGGLFMGSGDDGLFFRWLGAGLIAQLMAISTLLYGR